MENDQEITLRDELSASFDSVMDAQIPGPADAAPAAAPAETETQRDERLRDEAGRFAKQEAKTDQPSAGKPSAQPAAPAGSETTAQPAAAQQRPPRPSSWKKDYEAQWEQLDPKLAEYINQREREYASGVSTYKSEAENARSLNEALAPFIPNLQKYNIEPTQWIRNLGMAHERLALGSPQDKVATAVQLLRDYQIDPNALFNAIQNPHTIQQSAYQPPPQPQVDIDKLVEQKFVEREIKSEYERFVADAPTKYPHYESVKETMAGLLQAGLAQDYKTAYEAALRHPRHDDIWQAERQQREQAEAAAAAEKAKGVVNRARSNAVSVRSSTPSANMATQQGNKSLRDQLSSAFEEVTTGRV